MGLKIWDLLPKKELEIEELEGKILAIDASPVLYQFLVSIRQKDGTPLIDSKNMVTSHLMGLSNRIPNLISRGLKLFFCFDGKSPTLKINTQEDREYRKQIAEKKFEEAREKEDIKEMYKYSKQTVRLSKKIIEESKELIKAFGLPVIQCPGEAEAQCSFIVEKGDAWAVISQDADALLYSTPRLIRNLTVSQKRRLSSGAYITIRPELIELKKDLDILGINHDQLMALSILTGSDYNQEVPKVGPKTALKLVKQYNNFDELFKEVKADFNWKQVYATFKNMPIIKNYKLKWNSPDAEKIKEILVERHDFNEERVNKNLDRIINIKKAKSNENLDKWF